MSEGIDKINEMEEAAEERLHELVKLAGDEARSRRKKAVAQHLKRLQAAVDEGVARWEKPVTT